MKTIVHTQFQEMIIMAALNAEMKETFSKVKVFPVATASKAGVPNVAPIAFVRLVADDTIWIADNYMNKSHKNLVENPLVAVYVWDPDAKKCFQIKGKAELKTKGTEYDKMVAMVHEKMPQAPAKTLIIMKITEVFQCAPGPDAGKKLI